MPIDLGTIKTKTAELRTPASILTAASFLVTVLAGWENLLRLYRSFVDWAPWFPTAVVQLSSVLISVVVVVLLHRVIGSLLELVYFGPLKRLNNLEREVHEEIPRLQGRSRCQTEILCIVLKHSHLTPSQRQELTKLAKLLATPGKFPRVEGARQVFSLLSDRGVDFSPRENKTPRPNGTDRQTPSE